MDTLVRLQESHKCFLLAVRLSRPAYRYVTLRHEPLHVEPDKLLMIPCWGNLKASHKDWIFADGPTSVSNTPYGDGTNLHSAEWRFGGTPLGRGLLIATFHPDSCAIGLWGWHYLDGKIVEIDETIGMTGIAHDQPGLVLYDDRKAVANRVIDLVGLCMRYAR